MTMSDPRIPRLSPYEAKELQAENARLRSELSAARRGLRSVQTLIDHSYGVAGLHLNGDEAPWESLMEGGFYEVWLLDFSKAIDAAMGEGDGDGL